MEPCIEFLFYDKSGRQLNAGSYGRRPCITKDNDKLSISVDGAIEYIDIFRIEIVDVDEPNGEIPISASPLPVIADDFKSSGQVDMKLLQPMSVGAPSKHPKIAGDRFPHSDKVFVPADDRSMASKKISTKLTRFREADAVRIDKRNHQKIYEFDNYEVIVTTATTIKKADQFSLTRQLYEDIALPPIITSKVVVRPKHNGLSEIVEKLEHLAREYKDLDPPCERYGGARPVNDFADGHYKKWERDDAYFP